MSNIDFTGSINSEKLVRYKEGNLYKGLDRLLRTGENLRTIEVADIAVQLPLYKPLF